MSPGEKPHFRINFFILLDSRTRTVRLPCPYSSSGLEDPSSASMSLLAVHCLFLRRQIRLRGKRRRGEAWAWGSLIQRQELPGPANRLGAESGLDLRFANLNFLFYDGHNSNALVFILLMTRTTHMLPGRFSPRWFSVAKLALLRMRGHWVDLAEAGRQLLKDAASDLVLAAGRCLGAFHPMACSAHRRAWLRMRFVPSQ